MVLPNASPHTPTLSSPSGKAYSCTPAREVEIDQTGADPATKPDSLETRITISNVDGQSHPGLLTLARSPLIVMHSSHTSHNRKANNESVYLVSALSIVQSSKRACLTKLSSYYSYTHLKNLSTVGRITVRLDWLLQLQVYSSVGPYNAHGKLLFSNFDSPIRHPSLA